MVLTWQNKYFLKKFLEIEFQPSANFFPTLYPKRSFLRQNETNKSKNKNKKTKKKQMGTKKRKEKK